MLKSLLLFPLILILFLLPSEAFSKPVTSSPIFVIGQDVQSIDNFCLKLKNDVSNERGSFPDGFMTYVAINDLRGLSEPVDQGAGLNHAKKVMANYPDFKIIQMGLYVRYMLKEIIQGGLDQNISQLAKWIKQSTCDVYLRIGYEFDNPEHNFDAKDYILAYRHIVDRMRALGVGNVHFVWHTIAWADKDWPTYDLKQWYPGDQYVDWVGVSFFDADHDKERKLAVEFARSHNKPLMIAESSPFSQSTVKQKSRWIDKLFEFIHENDVRFLSYINVNWDALPMFKQYHWGDARLENEPKLWHQWLDKIKQY